jgi:hypothetical protein
MSVIVFDRDKLEHLEVISDRPRRLRGSMLLWIDLHRGSQFNSDEVADALELDEQTWLA